MFSTLNINSTREENSSNYIRPFPDGGWVTCTTVKNGSSSDIVVLRYDVCGSLLFSQRYNAAAAFFRLGDVIVDDDASVLVSVYSY